MRAIDNLQGRIWRRIIAKEELPALEKEHAVISTKLLAGRTVVHVHSDSLPGAGFEPMAPDLEDVYFSAMAASRLATAAPLVAHWSDTPAQGTFGHADRSAVAGLGAGVAVTDGNYLGLRLGEPIQLLRHAQSRSGLRLLDSEEKWIGGRRLGESGASSENEKDGPEQQGFGHVRLLAVAAGSEPWFETVDITKPPYL